MVDVVNRFGREAAREEQELEVKRRSSGLDISSEFDEDILWRLKRSRHDTDHDSEDLSGNASAAQRDPSSPVIVSLLLLLRVEYLLTVF